ncbi:hypothetical protein KDH_70940 [Dictyobacter sp. S3.2.2.5]|uniref:DUF2267 domain-containing protein n=1 Tax=Dictyobacter halimunensis TaxID=3026934 RepID=A0ABQ6G406_9CHLR|nr:hypothetical protein KDH_70940 [Dictyobacter sp. S3.2.2.5]
MKHDEFMGQVQHRARLSSRGEAERATRATLETLAERLAGGEAQDLAAQLPPEIGDYLRDTWSAKGERFSLHEFFQRVSLRERVDVQKATFHARAVIDVLKEAVSQGELKDARAQLPADFNRLFEAGSEGKMPQVQ